MILGEEDLGNAVRVLFGDGSNNAVIPVIESCTCVHHASNHRGIRVVEGLTKEKRDVGHKALDPNRNDWAHWADTSGEDADVVHVGDMSASATTLAKARCVRRSAGASSTCNCQSNTGRIASRNADCLVDLLGDAFLALSSKSERLAVARFLRFLLLLACFLRLFLMRSMVAFAFSRILESAALGHLIT